MILRTIILLILNFTALAIGGLFTSSGVKSEWYTLLEKAPWTPPGWVFGFAWTLIMICFAFYISFLWESMQVKRTLVFLFAVQWILNVSWNPLFFKFHQVNLALIVIVLLTLLVTYLLFKNLKELQLKSILILPYFLWLIIATSLNAYISLKN
ncbi:MAG: tryptophan-rich sensory protein [Chitinophagaceae bacterium]|jgi:tryptophan-rich sensory protein|nr:tryptophan-rich sensory protein [Chitinophagaceae bacterium]